MKRQLTIICICYTGFVVYGSLVPWHFNGLTIHEALTRFQYIPYLELGIASRADWVANILLFIPLAFLWMTRIALQQRLAGKILITVFVLAGSIFLCVAIEFAQIFFPPRTVSLNDVIAETLGAIIGVATYWLMGNRFITWLSNWRINRSDTAFYLQIYIGILFIYNVLPLDLTLSPVEFYHKWREGRIILIPFSGLKGDIFRDVYDTLADIVLWVPVPWLWLRKRRLTLSQLLARALIAALVIEFFQLFVYSRVTDVTDILLAVIGAGIGIGLPRLYDDGLKKQGSGNAFKYTQNYPLNLFVIYCLWGIIVVSVFWYPYNFQFSHNNLLSFFEIFFSVPFQAYYYGTEYRAITEVFHKILLFIPFGSISGLIVKNIKVRSQGFVLAFILIAFWPLVVEFGQLFLPKKNADITDFILEILGGYLGFILIRKIYKNQPRQAEIDQYRSYSSISQNGIQEVNNSHIPKLGWLLGLLCAFLVFTLLFIASQSPSVPYNVRELFSSEYQALGALGLTLLLYWCFAYPLLYLLNMLGKNTSQNWFWIKIVMTHALGAWLLIRLIAPIESIHDIVGSPILSIPNELEMGYRFIALFSIFSLMMLGAGHCAMLSVIHDRPFKRLFFLGGFCSVPILLICFWVVVIGAATDNLTELMDNGGYSLLVVNILLYLFMFSCLGTLASLAIVFKKSKSFLPLLVLILVSAPLGYQLLSWGTETYILKYNTVFSAMQFLLSADRQSLLSEHDLQIRFSIMHVGFILITILTQIPMLMISYNTIKKYQKTT